MTPIRSLTLLCVAIGSVIAVAQSRSLASEVLTLKCSLTEQTKNIDGHDGNVKQTRSNSTIYIIDIDLDNSTWSIRNVREQQTNLAREEGSLVHLYDYSADNYINNLYINLTSGEYRHINRTYDAKKDETEVYTASGSCTPRSK